MRKSLIILSLISLSMLILAPIFYCFGRIDLSLGKHIMSGATAMWFLSATFLVGKKKDSGSAGTKGVCKNWGQRSS